MLLAGERPADNIAAVQAAQARLAGPRVRGDSTAEAEQCADGEADAAAA
jgi:hypothetical protein